MRPNMKQFSKHHGERYAGDQTRDVELRELRVVSFWLLPKCRQKHAILHRHEGHVWQFRWPQSTCSCGTTLLVFRQILLNCQRWVAYIPAMPLYNREMWSQNLTNDSRKRCTTDLTTRFGPWRRLHVWAHLLRHKLRVEDLDRLNI